MFVSLSLPIHPKTNQSFIGQMEADVRLPFDMTRTMINHSAVQSKRRVDGSSKAGLTTPQERMSRQSTDVDSC